MVYRGIAAYGAKIGTAILIVINMTSCAFPPPVPDAAAAARCGNVLMHDASAEAAGAYPIRVIRYRSAAMPETLCETVRLAPGYRFARSDLRTVDAIFEAARTDVVDRTGPVALLRVRRRDGNRLAVIAVMAPGRHAMRLIYGPNTSEISKRYAELTGRTTQMAMHRDAVAVTARWDYAMTFLSGIIEREPLFHSPLHR